MNLLFKELIHKTDLTKQAYLTFQSKCSLQILHTPVNGYGYASPGMDILLCCPGIPETNPNPIRTQSGRIDMFRLRFLGGMTWSHG